MLKVFLFLCFAWSGIAWAAPLTDTAACVPDVVRSLATAAGTSFDHGKLGAVKKYYEELTHNPQYKQAHKVYRLLAAMTDRVVTMMYNIGNAEEFVKTCPPVSMNTPTLSLH